MAEEQLMTVERKTIRLAATADLHCTRTSQGMLQPLFEKISGQADVLVLCGDLTDHGLPEEAQVLARELSPMRLPVIAVLGNHDFDCGKQKEVYQILAEAGVQVLDGESCEVLGIGFAGVKGFAGGFDRHALEPWGEENIKHFVRESVEETLKLESALARLKNSERVALLHYSPVKATVEGEPPEIFAFLGSSRLEEPLNRYAVTAVFHGHAHHGSPEGKTRSAIPVYNVSMKLLHRIGPEQLPFRVVPIPRENGRIKAKGGDESR
jgi:Icc-related predicted phosphoesterase